MSVEMNQVSTLKSQSSTVFLIDVIINAYIPKGIPKEVGDLIVLFAYTQADYNTAGTFVADTAGWQMKINISFTESKINKFVNTQMSKNDIRVYLPYVVERRWSIKKLKQEILKMNGIDADLHEEYTLWVWRRWLYEGGYPRYTWMFAPDVDDNTKMKKLYQTCFKAYIPAIVNKKWRTVSSKLNAGEKCIFSKYKPPHIEKANFYALGNCNGDYTKAQLFKLWGGKDLTKKDPAWKKQLCEYPTWDPPNRWPYRF